jgi:hypothetical protein
MARTRKDQTNKNTTDKMAAAGRGRGEGASWRSWIEPQDVPSLGYSHRVKGWKTDGRVVNLLSNLELCFFYMVEWDPCVVDIREQFPLELEMTLELAKQLKVRHPSVRPRIPRSSRPDDPALRRLRPVIMTTDFNLTVEVGGKRSHRAYAIKPKSALEGEGRGPKRTRQKLKIEELYWEACGVPWALITEDRLDRTLARNVEAVHSCYDLQSYSASLTQEMAERAHEWLFPRVAAGGTCLADLAEHCDGALGLPTGASLVLAKHLIARRRWPVDFSVPFNPCRPLALQAQGGLAAA